MARRAAQALCDEGKAFLEQEKWDEALAALRAAVAKDPEMSGAWFAVAYAEGKSSGKKTEAEIDAYEHCIKLDPKHANAHNNLGVALKNVRKDFDGAEAMYRKAIELDPKDALAHHNLSLLLEKRGDVEGAIRETREFIRKGGHPGVDGEARVERLRAKQANG